MKAIEKLKGLKKIGTSMQQDGKGVPLKIVFEEPFCLDKVIIEKKDIIKYIKGKSIPLLGEDFYYCYTYDGGVLNFVSFKSSSYQTGAVHLVVKAILHEGRYCAQTPSSSILYYIDNDGQRINVEVDYDVREGYEMLHAETARRDIQEALKSFATIRASWSLQKSALSINVLLIAVFAALMVAALTVSWKLKSAKVSFEAERARKSRPVASANISARLPDVVSVISKVGDEVYGKGVIEKAEIRGGNMEFVISFKTEQSAQSFMRQFGGSYEQGKIIYSTPVSPGR
jgi:hypothetical protein